MLSRPDDLDLSVSGSGKIYTGDITVSDLGCSISGSGDIILGSSGNAYKARHLNQRIRKL